MDIREPFPKSRETGHQESIDSILPCDICIKNTEDLTEPLRIIVDYPCSNCKVCAKRYTKEYVKLEYMCPYGLTRKRSVDQLFKETSKREKSRQESLDSKPPCDLCIKNIKDTEKAFKTIADYLCFKCKLYLCAKCYIEGHAKHSYVCAVGVTKERETKVEQFVDELLKETSKLRKKQLKKEKYNPVVVDSVCVQHQLDWKYCEITGLCGFNIGRLVVSDYNNKSIKVIKLGSNVVERFIKLSDQPFDVTEIKITQTPIDSDSATSMASSETEETQMGTKTLLAVTVPSMRSIIYINLNETPATQVKCISRDMECYGIEFCDGRIYTSVGWLPSSNVVCILSIDGIILKRVECIPEWNIGGYLAAVSPGKIYIISGSRDTVICMDDKGVIMSRITMKRDYLTGISAENDGSIYVYSWDKHNLYRMDADLKQRRLVLDEKYSRYIKNTYHVLCCLTDRLYVGHRQMHSDISNYVTVVKLYE